jgi:hypothetical protein
MNSWQWIRNSLIFHRRTHAAAAAATAVATAVLAGAVLTGEALNRDLARIATERIGGVRAAIDLGSRLADARLADAIQRRTGGIVAPVLQVDGSLVQRAEGQDTDTLGDVRVLGADDRLCRLFYADRAGADLLLSRRLAAAAGWDLPAAHSTARIHLGADSQPALRVARLSPYPLDLPLGDRRKPDLIRRVVPNLGVLADARMGRFSLEASQIPPRNAVVDRTWLAAAVGATGQVNLFVTDQPAAVLAAALHAAWQPADVGIRIGDSTNGCRLVTSDRAFLPASVVAALGTVSPSPVFALHHLADGFAAWNGATATATTPYGFVAALTPNADARLGVVPAALGDDEVVINAWLADKLALAVGGTLRLSWRRFEAGGDLVAETADLRVAGVLPMAAVAVERNRMPAFPGLSEADSCADWDIGLPMDEAKLADPDNEKYWKKYGPTPKAFVTLRTGQRLFGTAFGSATGARLAAEVTPEALEAAWRTVSPETLGLTTRDIAIEARLAVAGAMDFKQLFVGMACVLLVAALLLVALLAALGVDSRRVEIGTLRASGLSARRMLGLWLAEAAVPITFGTTAGAFGGWLFARVLIWGLNQYWGGAAPGMQVVFEAAPMAWAGSAVLAGLLSLASVWLSVRRICRMEVQALLIAGGGEPPVAPRPRRCGLWLAALGLAVAGATAMSLAGQRAAAESAGGFFFTAGLLQLVAVLAFGRAALWAMARMSAPQGGVWRAGLMGVLRRPGRNLLVAALLAVGCFLSVGVLAMRHDPAAALNERRSGSGGFAWMLTTTAAVPIDRVEALNTALHADAENVVALRVRDGAEAGCRNLNRTGMPRVLGMDAAVALKNGIFGVDDDARRLLLQSRSDGCVPALAGDLTTVQYGLAATADPVHGTILNYPGPTGGVQRIRIVGALPVRTGILQGNLIVDARAFAALFPDEPGYRMWLIRPKAGASGAAPARYRRLLGRQGVEVVAVAERLTELGAVEAAYLNMFLVLGGLGAVLGAAGVGLIVLRHAFERRLELAALRVLGWGRWQVAAYLLAEHGSVLLFGLGAGAWAAGVAVQPVLLAARQAFPLGAVCVLLLAMLGSGLIWTLAAVWAVTSGDAWSTLREE